MLRVIEPLESAQDARDALAKVQEKLAEAQVEIAHALKTLAMFERNWAQGHYQKREPQWPITTTAPLAARDLGREEGEG